MKRYKNTLIIEDAPIESGISEISEISEISGISGISGTVIRHQLALYLTR